MVIIIFSQTFETMKFLLLNSRGRKAAINIKTMNLSFMSSCCFFKFRLFLVLYNITLLLIQIYSFYIIPEIKERKSNI